MRYDAVSGSTCWTSVRLLIIGWCAAGNMKNYVINILRRLFYQLSNCINFELLVATQHNIVKAGC